MNFMTLLLRDLFFEMKKLRARINERIDRANMTRWEFSHSGLKTIKKDIDLNWIRYFLREISNIVHGIWKHPDEAKDMAKYLNHANCTIRLTDEDLNAMTFRSVHHSATSGFIRLHNPDDIYLKKKNFMKNIEIMLENIIDSPEFAQDIQNICIDALKEFIDECVKSAGHNENTAIFFSYIIDEIKKRIDSEKFIDAIKYCMKREERPHCEINELNREIYKIIKRKTDRPSFQNRPGFLGKEFYPVSVELFGETFTQAYQNVLFDRIKTDIFRIVAANLLNDLNREIIENSMSFFKKFNAKSVQEQLNDDIVKLEKCRNTLKQIKEQYGE